MKLVQLLSGAAAAALLAGVASAQVISVDSANAFDGVGATGDFEAAGTVLASELDIASAALTGELMISADLSGFAALATLGASDNVDFTIDLTGFEFTRVVTSADFGSVAGGALNDCAFDIQAGGGTGSNSVTFRSSGQVNQCADTDLLVNLPVQLNANNANVSYDFALVGPGTNLADGTLDADGNGANGNQPLVTQSPAFAVAINDGFAPSDLDANDFVLFGGNTSDQFGSVVLTDNGVDEDLAGTNIAFGTVGNDTHQLVITFADATGIASVELSLSDDIVGGDTTTCIPAGNTCTIALDDSEVVAVGADAGEIFVISANNNANPIVAQALSAALTLNADTGYTTSPIVVTGSALDAIGRDDGVSPRTPTGFNNNANSFPWTNLRASGGTQSNFRLTGLRTDLAQDSDECIQVVVGGTNGALPGASTACLDSADVTVTADGVAATTWTATFNSTAIANALGVTTEAINGNVSFNVITADSAPGGNGQIERLLVKSGIITGTSFDNQ